MVKTRQEIAWRHATQRYIKKSQEGWGRTSPVISSLSLPENWSCFPGPPQGGPRGSSCQSFGTSPELELSSMNGFLERHLVQTCDTPPHTLTMLSTNHPIQQHPTHRLLALSAASGRGRVLFSPGSPSWVEDTGSTRWNSNGVRFCVRYTT